MPPITPDPPRRARAIIAFTASALFGLFALGLTFHRLGDPERVDEPADLDVFIHSWVVRHRPDLPRLTGLFHAATRFGNPEIAILATGLVAFSLYALSKRDVGGVRRSEAVVWTLVILGGRYLGMALKSLYRRERPPVPHRLVTETSYSFPSGHSVFAAVFFAMLAVVLARVIPPSRRLTRAVAVATCLALAVLVGASRVWLGVHYPSDVVAGLLLGFGWVIAATFARHGHDRWRRRGSRDA